MTAPRVLSVGQCLPDHARISRTFHNAFGVEVVPASSTAAALDLIQRERFALVLVNRIFDADGSSGLEFIRQLKADQTLGQVQTLLVSDYPEA